jgi:hypothetical protein
VGKEALWMNIHEIHLVMPVQDFILVPRIPPIIKGITEIRGKIVTLIDLNPLFSAGANGSAPLHAALFSYPYSHLAICLHSDFDVVEGPESISFTAVKKTDPDHALGVKKRLNIKSARYRFLEADEIIQLCENHIREYVKKNLLMISPGEKNEESHSHRG